MITCKHCNTPNDSRRDECSNCGTPLPRTALNNNGSDSPDIPAKSAEEPCHCVSPEVEYGTNRCMFCGGTISEEPAPDEAPYVESIQRSSPSSQELCRNTSVILPGPISIPVGDGLILGRDTKSVPNRVARIMANYPGVSRRHLWVSHHHDDLLLVDMGSANGTQLNGQYLIPFKLYTVPLIFEDISLRLCKALEIKIDTGDHR